MLRKAAVEEHRMALGFRKKVFHHRQNHDQALVHCKMGYVVEEELHSLAGLDMGNHVAEEVGHSKNLGRVMGLLHKIAGVEEELVEMGRKLIQNGIY